MKYIRNSKNAKEKFRIQYIKITHVQHIHEPFIKHFLKSSIVLCGGITDGFHPIETRDIQNRSYRTRDIQESDTQNTTYDQVFTVAP